APRAREQTDLRPPGPGGTAGYLIFSSSPRATMHMVHTAPVNSVNRSRFFSTTDEPDSDDDIEPPNIDDRPPPLPPCSRVRDTHRVERKHEHEGPGIHHRRSLGLYRTMWQAQAPAPLCRQDATRHRSAREPARRPDGNGPQHVVHPDDRHRQAAVLNPATRRA